MKKILLIVTLFFSLGTIFSQEYISPECVIFDDSRDLFYVSNVGNYQDPDGFILTVDLEDKKEYLISTGLNDPKGMVIVGNNLYVTDLTKIVEINLDTKSIANSFTITGAVFINDIELGNNNVLYMSDMGGNKIYKFDLNNKTSSVLSLKSTITAPNGLLFEKESNRLYAVGFAEPSILYTINLTDNSVSNYTLPFDFGDGITKNSDEQFIISAWGNTTNPFFEGEIYQMDKISGDFEMIADGFSGPSDIYYFSLTDELLIPEMMMDFVYFLPLSQTLTKPVLIKPANNSTDNIPINLDFEWLSDKNITKYVFHLSKNNDFTNEVISVNMWTQNTLTLEVLDFNTTYYWKIVGYTDTDSIVSDTWSFITTQKTIDEVNLISPAENEDIATKVVNFVWSKGTAPNYELQIDVSKQFNTPEFKGIIGLIETSFAPAEYLKNGTYYWRVRNYSEVNSSPYSKVGTFIMSGAGFVENEIFINKIKVYPNPIESTLNIDIAEDINVNSISIYSSTGEMIYWNNEISSISKIDLSNFSSGSYFIEFNTNNETFIKKIIKK